MEHDLSNKLVRILSHAGGPLRLAQICAALGVVGGRRGYSARDKAARKSIRRELARLEREGRAERADVDEAAAGWRWVSSRSVGGQICAALVAAACVDARRMFWESLL